MLDPETGVITFTPAHGYSGTPAGVSFRITDAEDAEATATYTPTVNLPAPPSQSFLDSTGQGTAGQTVTAPIPSEGSVALINGVEPTNVIDKEGVGLFMLDPETGVITYAPEPGFLGTDGINFEMTDLYGQSATGWYFVTVELPEGPTAAPLTSTGQPGVQQTAAASVPTGGSAGLVDGENTADQLTVDGEGVYAIDTTTGALTFDPADGFTGTGTGVTYEVTDSYDQRAESTYVPTVSVNAPSPVFHITTARDAFVMGKSDDTIDAVCWMGHGREDKCTIQLTARINGVRTLIGSGSAVDTSGPGAHRIAVSVHLDKIGQALLDVRKHGHKAVLRASGRLAGSTDWLDDEHQIHLSRG